MATLLFELTEQIDPQKLVAATQTAPIAWAQRLGYLLEHVASHEQASLLKAHVKDKGRQPVPTSPGATSEEAPRDVSRKILVNAELEPNP